MKPVGLNAVEMLITIQPPRQARSATGGSTKGP